MKINKQELVDGAKETIGRICDMAREYYLPFVMLAGIILLDVEVRRLDKSVHELDNIKDSLTSKELTVSVSVDSGLE